MRNSEALKRLKKILKEEKLLPSRLLDDIELNIHYRINNLIRIHVMLDSDLSFRLTFYDAVRYNKVPISSSERLLVTESILKELK